MRILLIRLRRAPASCVPFQHSTLGPLQFTGSFLPSRIRRLVNRPAQGAQHVVVILDTEEGHSRLLSIDDSGYHELHSANMAGLAGEVDAVSPDLILVNPDALNLAGSD